MKVIKNSVLTANLLWEFFSNQLSGLDSVGKILLLSSLDWLMLLWSHATLRCACDNKQFVVHTHSLTAISG